MQSKRPRSPLRRRFDRNLVRLTSALGAAIVRRLGLRPLRAVARGFAWLIYHCVPSRQRLADRNLESVFGSTLSPADRARIRRFVTAGIVKTMVELLKLPYMTDEELRQVTSLEGAEHIAAGLAKGRGVLLVTAHYGNWELFGARIAIEGFPITVVALDASDPLTASYINRARQSKGVVVIGREGVHAMLRALRANHCLAILPDQHSVGGIWVDFLGRPACTATGPARLAAASGCVVLPVFSYRDDTDHIHCRVFPPLDLVRTGDREHDARANTELLNATIAEQIRKDPRQWLWLHDRWREPPPDAGRQATGEPSAPPAAGAVRNP